MSQLQKSVLSRWISALLSAVRYVRAAKVIPVEPVVFLYMFGTYLSFPLSQQYSLNRFSLDVLENTSYPYKNETRCIYKENVTEYTGDNTTYGDVVVAKSTLIFIAGSSANLLASAIVTLLLGPLSDRYGRRLVMVLVALGASLQGVGSLLIARFNLNMYFFVGFGAVQGMFGGFGAILMASYAYISDVSSEKWRTMRIGLVESMLFVSGLLAEGLGLLWFQKLNCDIIPPYYLYLACNLAIVFYALVFLPPSLTREEREEKNANKPRGIKALLRGASIFFCCIREYAVWKLWVALVPVFIVMIIGTSQTSIASFFFGDLNWSQKRLGAYQAVSFGSHAVGLIIVLPVLVKLKLPDPLISLIGILVNISMNLLIGLSNRTYQLFVAASIQGLDAFMVAPLRSYMSKVVSAGDQGAAFSFVGFVETVGSMLAIPYTYALPALLAHHFKSGTVYVILSGFGVLSIPFLSVLLTHWCIKKTQERHQTQQLSEKAPLLN